MATVTPISEGQAASFQQMYEQIFESWLRQSLLDKQLEKDAQKQQENKSNQVANKEENQQQKQADDHSLMSGIKITDGEEVVYERKNNQTLVNDITPELIGKLGVMKETSIGEKVVGAEKTTLEVDGKIVLQSDAEGKMIVNELKLERELNRNQQTTNPSSLENSSSFIPHLSSLETSSSFIPHHSSLETSLQKDGLEFAVKALENIDDNSVKTLLKDTLTEIQSLREQNTQLQQQYTDLVNNRTKESRDINWWSETSDKVKEFVQSIQQDKENQKAAETIKELFNRTVESNGTSYQAEGYSIKRNGNNYTLNDSEGNELMAFRSQAMGGVKIEGEVKLTETQRQEISQLKQQLERGENNLENFAPVGTKEAKYFAQLNQIANTLTEYAASEGRKVEIQGQSYKWTATPDGQARIDANDGRGTLFIKSNGKVMSRMNERDLAHFEQALEVVRQQTNNRRSSEVQEFRESFGLASQTEGKKSKQLEI